MEKEYSSAELIEMGKAEDLILGKEGPGPDEGLFDQSSSDIEE